MFYFIILKYETFTMQKLYNTRYFSRKKIWYGAIKCKGSAMQVLVVFYVKIK